MVALKEALPILVLEVESALVRIGRGDVANQLREAMIERWTYDDNADTAYLDLRAAGSVEGTSAGSSPGDTISVYDEVGINLETDSQGRLTRMEILGGRAVFMQLEEGRGSPPARAAP